ncbi:GNAT family protein [Photobacterium sp. 1_MG-2023]|uniref:GNAT family protein n=1 Tax=Photobacterium sp. 1_MG-2023 TaxID=3062646 RepID=UPI0026E2D163|nr:GNAT family protein [Photobacterium sp. 1_MG-2023]MDO6708681.1 GNAT family protein [Photobacterium sp. 1_MG-2023]
MQFQIKLEGMKPAHLEQVSALSVVESQLPFVGTMEEILVNVDDVVHPVVIQMEARVVGFFLVDTQYGQRYNFAPEDALGLRGFFVDQHYQGQGIGTRAVAALKTFLRAEYPHANQIVLTVNCKNPAAKICYERGGFIDAGELYHGGAAGPQHVMSMMLETQEEAR